MDFYQSTTLWSFKDNVMVIFINYRFLMSRHGKVLAPFHVDRAVEEWIFPLYVTTYWMVVCIRKVGVEKQLTGLIVATF